MTDHLDAWYIRLPDGRILRAGSTAAVRHHLEAGRLSADCRVRRSSRDPWVLLEACDEFADLIPSRPRVAPASRRSSSSGVNAPTRGPGHGNGLGLQTVGVPGCVEELLKALDSTLVRGKLLTVLCVGLVGAGLLTVANLLRPGQDVWWPLPWLAAGLALLVAQAVGACLVTQSTFIELSRLRPAVPGEAAVGLGRNAFRLAVAEFVVVGLFVGASVGLGTLEGILRGQGQPDALVGAVAAVRLVVEVVFWPVLGLSLLLAPTIIVEECSPFRALGLWAGLVRQHPGRTFVYEALAVGLGAVVSFPLIFPVALAVGSAAPAELANPVVHATLATLAALALTPLLAYLTVANVSIYLNLKYEQSPGAH
ncbi:MAG: hypothetical protein IT429_22915 [Gemmataceae bacterium]|nr:hypothetical protein [Gemmataceae bacterium]